MLVIRLSRTGRKKQPNYRVVVAEKSAAVKGRFLEILGHYNPRTKDLQLDADRAKAVLADGAQPSETAEALLQKAGVLKREPITEKNRRPTRQKRLGSLRRLGAISQHSLSPIGIELQILGTRIVVTQNL